MPKPLIKVVAAVIFNESKHILVTQRPEGGHLAGYWEFPGGRIEEGESPEQALQREIKEELDIDIAVGDFLWRGVFEYDIKVVDIAFYACKLTDTTQKITCKGIAGYRWVLTEEMSRLQFPPADKEMIFKLKWAVK
ncbi:MAG: 8-oxo-dGTP diphosphatase MutT [Calditrichaceae bacterium]|nr:8-oxo-dGTP diphosphatase MutT [Calditrichaceae bacterium]MBN2710486.1 8-oxo-dGTP diphosphatase MutT [Calditrichaceae bacterium]RQV97277.1 MAG: 8-oxo-dGTP diphosphatase MutT [Calditrichota bacterium]